MVLTFFEPLSPAMGQNVSEGRGLRAWPSDMSKMPVIDGFATIGSFDRFYKKPALENPRFCGTLLYSL